jgi:hypothetical protein
MYGMYNVRNVQCTSRHVYVSIFFRGKEISITHSEGVFIALDRFALGSGPYGPDAPTTYRRALCAP